MASDVEKERVLLRRERRKNNEPRGLPLVGELAQAIERRREAREFTRLGATHISRYVFHTDGLPVGDFRKAWATACKWAGKPGLLFRDLRRSAVRNLERAGVSQSVAMKITGHKAASVYRRYRIVDERDMLEALERSLGHIQAEDRIRARPEGRVTAQIRG